MQGYLRLENIHKSFGKTEVIKGFNLSLKQGSMTTLLGPSGCGKTTILRLIAGLDLPTSGQIFLEEREITQTAPQDRDIGIVFQSYALFPHLTVAENVGYSLKMQGISKSEVTSRVQEALALVELSGLEDRMIDQLSGGQQQRVALARSLILKPKVLLFDEPLSNLDANLRRVMRENIRHLQQKLNITALYVTHDQTEAFAVSDEVIVMNKGEIVQQGSPQMLYRQPKNEFMAKFMGEVNLLPAQKQGKQLKIGEQILTLESQQFPQADGNYTVGIRPEAVKLSQDFANSAHHPANIGEVQNAIYMGSYWELQVKWQSYQLIVYAELASYDEQKTSYQLDFGYEGIFLL
nr:ATP-binding cassette domain-containing protein [uncultured Haemophilus sp.]